MIHEDVQEKLRKAVMRSPEKTAYALQLFETGHLSEAVAVLDGLDAGITIDQLQVIWDNRPLQ